MNKIECIKILDNILDLENEFNKIRTLKSKDEMIKINTELSKNLVEWYNQAKEYICGFGDEDLKNKLKETSKIINIANEIDDFIKYDVKI